MEKPRLISKQFLNKNEFEKRIKVQERNLYVLKELAQIVFFCVLGALILSYNISENYNVALRIAIFCGIIAVINYILVNIEQFFLYFKIKRPPFLIKHLLRLLVQTIALLIVFIIFFYLKDNSLILTQENLHLLVKAFIYSLCIGFIFTISAVINKMIGYGILWKYLSGKYHNPREEERIFMFLDLKDSTTIAENLGSYKYFSLINEVIYTLTPSIIQNKGEIYKYVGDELIITWSQKNGFKNNNCIRTFFDIQDRILKEREVFIEKYGVVPDFKAGIHIGKAIVGEMGDFKSEIAYMGDAVNTAARLQSERNTYNVKLLISNELLLYLKSPFFFSYQLIDAIRLKGKLTETIIYNVFLPELL